MFNRREKKIKAVFKMQFQATQVPQLKAKGLMISLVPVDVGKPTVRLAKAPIIDGTCTWENPVYETVKLVMETKTGRIREKFYYVIVSTGSSKAGFLGEVSIDFADLAEATKPLNLTLPLQTSKSGAVLHVTVQKMQGGDSRYDEDCEAPVDGSYDQDLDTKEDSSEVASPHDERNASTEDAESDSNETNNMHGRLMNQMKVLERKAELSELEVQSLRKQIIKDTRREQQLSEQIDCLKEENNALKAECAQLKSSTTCKNDEADSGHVQKVPENLKSSLEDIKQRLQQEKHLNKKLKLQLQKTEDSNSEFVLALRDLNKKLDQKNNEISRLSSKIKAFYSSPEALASSPRTVMDQNGLANKCENADETEMLKQKIENLQSEIEIHKKEKADIQIEVRRLTQDNEYLEINNKDISARLELNQKEKMKTEHNHRELLATMKQFKLQIASLDDEIERQTLQYSEALSKIDVLESQVENLQIELEKQAQIFEDDLQAMTEAKLKQEHRAIQAEDALKRTRWSNANTAERLQEEFKQLSAEMSLKIEENETRAQKAVTEANDLRQKNEILAELIQKAKEELQVTRAQYDRVLRERPEQSDEDIGSNKSSKMRECKTVSGQEYEQMRTSTAESGMLQRLTEEKEDLKRQLASLKKESEKLMQENNSVKSQLDQKRAREENLHLEVKKLRLKNNEFKNHLHGLEQEKEDMRKEIKKVKEAMPTKYTNAVVGKLDDLPTHNGTETTQSTRGASQLPATEQKIRHGSDSCDASSLLGEVALLKERNKSMEEALKEMHDRYSEISLRFAEVEGERQQLVMALRNLKSGRKS